MCTAGNLRHVVTTTIVCRTWRNAQVGEHIIEQLENKSETVAQEKQEVIGKGEREGENSIWPGKVWPSCVL